MADQMMVLSGLIYLELRQAGEQLRKEVRSIGLHLSGMQYSSLMLSKRNTSKALYAGYGC